MADRGTPGAPSPDGGIRSINPRLVAGGILAVLLVVFLAQNRNKVRVNFLFLHFTWPVFLVMLVCVLAGLVLGALLARSRYKGDER